MCSGMGELVFLVVPTLYVDEYTKVMGSRSDSNACASEFGAELIEPTSGNTFLRAVDPES